MRHFGRPGDELRQLRLAGRRVAGADNLGQVVGVREHRHVGLVQRGLVHHEGGGGGGGGATSLNDGNEQFEQVDQRVRRQGPGQFPRAKRLRGREVHCRHLWPLDQH